MKPSDRSSFPELCEKIRNDGAITYDPRIRTFHIAINDGGNAGFQINFCPWTAPIPHSYDSDAWWRNDREV